VALKSTRTSERVPMPCCPVRTSALGTLLTGPRFRPNLNGDTVFLGGTRQPFGKLLERPEVVRFRIGLDRPVGFQHIGQPADIHRVHAFIVQSFD
jgi:hypothetical protein